MKFTSTLVSILAAAKVIDAFAPSQNIAKRSISSPSQRNAVIISADDINAKLAAQMQKLNKKDAGSTQLSGNVSTIRVDDRSPLIYYIMNERLLTPTFPPKRI